MTVLLVEQEMTMYEVQKEMIKSLVEMEMTN